jgi:hypothetical protein
VSTVADSGERSTNLRSWKNPSSDALDGLQARQKFLDDDEDDEERELERPRNHMGVEIMPQIVEEEEEDGDEILEFAQKRLSRV